MEAPMSDQGFLLFYRFFLIFFGILGPATLPTFVAFGHLATLSCHFELARLAIFGHFELPKVAKMGTVARTGQEYPNQNCPNLANVSKESG